MPRTLVDESLDGRLWTDGFVKVRLFDAPTIEAICDEFWGLRPDDGFDPPGGTPTNPTTYHCTFLDTSADYKAAFDDLVRRRFGPVVDEWFVDHDLLIGNAYVKQPGKGQFEVHQNWTLTDRPADVTVTIWLPLQPCNAANGTLQVVPGSHKLTRDIAYPRGAYFFSGFQDRIRDVYFEPVSVDLGEAVLFDDSLIHGSEPNRSDAPRAALQVEAIPAGSSPAVHLPREDGDFDVLHAPASFYRDTTQADIDRWSELYDRLDVVHNHNRPLDEATFAELLRHGDEVRARLWGTPTT